MVRLKVLVGIKTPGQLGFQFLMVRLKGVIVYGYGANHRIFQFLMVRLKVMQIKVGI